MTPQVQSNDPPDAPSLGGSYAGDRADSFQRNRRRVPTKGAPRFGGTGPIGKRWFALEDNHEHTEIPKQGGSWAHRQKTVGFGARTVNRGSAST
jgi:hypothetical protein